MPSKKKKKSRDEEELSPEPQELPVRLHEQLLIDLLPELEPTRVICTTGGRAQFAETCARQRPDVQVDCCFLDLFQKNQSQFQIDEHGPIQNLRLVCEPDLPDHEADLVAFVCRKGGDAELTRDLLQQGYLRLVDGGRLIASTDNDEDQWLHEQLRELFPKVTRRPVKKQGTVYLATRKGPLKKQKVFDSDFKFRDRGHLIHVYSRPGVFSHRRIDLGARTLINTMQIKPGMKVLDMGCGVGTVSLAASLAAENVTVMALDSNPRAVQCTQRSAELNELKNITAILDCEGQAASTGDFDLVLANPPYFSNYAIAELFLDTAYRALRQKGLVHVVTKTPNWFLERMPLWFTNIQEAEVGDYRVITGRR